MTNPLISAYEISRQNRAKIESNPAAVINDGDLHEINKIWAAARMATTEAGKRLAIATILACGKYESSYNQKLERYDIDQPEAAAFFVDDPFEAMLIGYALDGWWNDTLEAAFDALGLDINNKDWQGQVVDYAFGNTLPDKCPHCSASWRWSGAPVRVENADGSAGTTFRCIECKTTFNAAWKKVI